MNSGIMFLPKSCNVCGLNVLRTYEQLSTAQNDDGEEDFTNKTVHDSYRIPGCQDVTKRDTDKWVHNEE